ncbi:MAG: hypothetical protein O3A32_16205 [Proteobacteria bacterium]|nr:hypothetical protein [Pseudomonadota bacterium]
MVTELERKASVSVLYIAKDAAAVTALSGFFEGHMEFMKAKRETEGPRVTYRQLQYCSNSRWNTSNDSHIMLGHQAPEAFNDSWVAQSSWGHYHKLIPSHKSA